MATFLSGNVRKATANTVTAMTRSAASRQCPKCGRKSALKFHTDDAMYGRYCRWQDCGYEAMTIREFS
jgi:ribosomal protein S27AE